MPNRPLPFIANHPTIEMLLIPNESHAARPRQRRALRGWAVTFLLLIAITTFWPRGLAAEMPTRPEGESPRDYRQFLFLYEQTEAAGQSELFVHPFYSHYGNQERAYDYHTVLYPIFYSHGTNFWNRWTFLYFFTGDDFYHEDSADDTDLFLSPLFHLGFGEAEKEDYISVFPVYGSLRNKLGWSELSYFMFPVYATWAHRDYRAYGILWPLIMWGGSPTRNDFRVFPLYSSKKHFGKYERKTVLWPFFQWGSEGLDKVEPRHYFFSFPFYGRKWSDDGNLYAHTFLWLPFLGGFVAWGGDDARNSFQMNAFWFLYQYGYNEDPTIYRHIIFPFYGKYRFGTEPESVDGADEDRIRGTDDEQERLAEEGDDHFPGYEPVEGNPYYKEATFITPLYVNLKTHSSVVVSDYDIVIPFYWNDKRYYRREKESESYLKIWPLFHYIESDAGRYEFRSLALWPLRSDHFERNWGTYYALLENNLYENGDRYFATMLRLYSRYWNKSEEHHFLIGFEYHNTPDYWNVNFLGGFLGWRRDYPSDGGDAYNTLQLLWLDI